MKILKNIVLMIILSLILSWIPIKAVEAQGNIGIVAEVLVCAQRTKHTSWCRVILQDGRRVNVVAPVAVGDRVRQFNNRTWITI
jgi:hypothetical protein